MMERPAAGENRHAWGASNSTLSYYSVWQRKKEQMRQNTGCVLKPSEPPLLPTGQEFGHYKAYLNALIGFNAPMMWKNAV